MTRYWVLMKPKLHVANKLLLGISIASLTLQVYTATFLSTLPIRLVLDDSPLDDLFATHLNSLPYKIKLDVVGNRHIDFLFFNRCIDRKNILHGRDGSLDCGSATCESLSFATSGHDGDAHLHRTFARQTHRLLSYWLKLRVLV